MKTPNRPDETPNLEVLVQQTSYHQRDAALAELRAAIAAILQPRGGYRVYSGSSNRHFLPIPPSASVTINRAGWPNQATVDPQEAEELSRQLTAITHEEQRLEAAAGKAKLRLTVSILRCYCPRRNLRWQLVEVYGVLSPMW